MSDPVDALVLDLLEWVDHRPPRTYAEVMDAWRTSCPRLPVWEEANRRGLLVQRRADDGAVRVEPTAAGRAVIARTRSAGRA